MKNDIEIGNRIRTIREGLGLNRAKFSELIDISESFLTKVELGEKSISINTLMTISKCTGFSTDYILFGDPSNNVMQKKISRLLINEPENILILIYNIVKNITSFYKKEK